MFYFFDKAVISELSDLELIALTKEFGLEFIPSDSPLRKLCNQIHGDELLVQMLGLAVPISMELAYRLENIIGKEQSNPYNITKEVVDKYFSTATENEGNSEIALNIDITYEHEIVLITFDVDADDYGIHSGSYIKILPDGRVIVSLCEYLESGGVAAELIECFENHIK